MNLRTNMNLFALVQDYSESCTTGISEVFGPTALDVSPRIGHIHVTVDEAPWHWADASGEPPTIQGLPAGPHKVLIELADPIHKVTDSKTIDLVIP